MKWLSLLFLVLLSCQNPYVAPPPNTGGVVIAVGANGSIARSTDRGETWETSMANPNLPPSKVILGNKTFAGLVTFQQQPVMPSNQQGVNAAAAAGQINSVNGASEFFSDLYVKGTLYQQLGQQWTAQTSPFLGGLNAVACDGTNFIAVSSVGEIGVSTNNGVTWTLIVGANNPFAGAFLNSICYGNGTWVITTATGKIGYSTNTGTSWTLTATTPFGAAETVTVAYGNGMFVAGGSTGKLAYSATGQSGWTLSASTVFSVGPNAVRTIAFGVGVFVAGGNGGILSRSTDGINWSAAITTPFGANNIFSSCYGNGVFMIGGTNAGVATVGSISISQNLGISWGAYTTFTYQTYSIGAVYSISFYFGIFQIGTQFGVTVRSYDNGITWYGTLTPFGITSVLAGIAASTNNAVMTGNVGGVGNIATAGWNAVPLGTGAFYAPLPQSAAGWGEIVGTSGSTLSLPAGGMWFWWGWEYNAATGVVTGQNNAAGVSAGGTQILDAA